MRRFILLSLWHWLTVIDAVYAGVNLTYSRLAGHWLEPADELDDVERVDLAKTRVK